MSDRGSDTATAPDGSPARVSTPVSAPPARTVDVSDTARTAGTCAPRLSGRVPDRPVGMVAAGRTSTAPTAARTSNRSGPTPVIRNAVMCARWSLRRARRRRAVARQPAGRFSDSWRTVRAAWATAIRRWSRRTCTSERASCSRRAAVRTRSHSSAATSGAVSRTQAASRDPGSTCQARVFPMAGPTSSCRAENVPDASETPHTAAASTPPGRPASAEALVRSAKLMRASSRKPASAIATTTAK